MPGRFSGSLPGRGASLGDPNRVVHGVMGLLYGAEAGLGTRVRVCLSLGLPQACMERLLCPSPILGTRYAPVNKADRSGHVAVGAGWVQRPRAGRLEPLSESQPVDEGVSVFVCLSLAGRVCPYAPGDHARWWDLLGLGRAEGPRVGVGACVQTGLGGSVCSHGADPGPCHVEVQVGGPCGLSGRGPGFSQGGGVTPATVPGGRWGISVQAGVAMGPGAVSHSLSAP